MADKKTVVDERDVATQRLASHLNSFELANSVAVIEDEPVETESLKLPNDAKKVLALLAEAQSLPSKTKTEHVIKANRIHQITAHLHAIQQGIAVPVFDSGNTRALAEAQSENAEQILIEDLGRRFPVVKKLSDQLAESLATIETLKKKK